ncbi:MAG: hypothetical protein Q9227_007126 [Pyrenula ochraceoflavens]
MTILITGSLGKVSSRIAPLLHASGHPFLIASRSGKAPPSSPYHFVQFDWLDESTFSVPFSSPEAQQSPITTVYLLAPPVLDPVPHMKRFIDFAKSQGVRRFVQQSASSLPEGGPLYGQVHAYLKGLGVEWTVLRPTWFMRLFQSTIRNNGWIRTATEDGRVPFVSCEDIAAVAYCALVEEKAHNTDHIILGPETLTYDDELGRKVEHVKISADQRVEDFTSAGIPQEYAKLLTEMDVAISRGAENQMNSTVERITGQKPMTMRDFAEKNRRVWD